MVFQTQWSFLPFKCLLQILEIFIASFCSPYIALYFLSHSCKDQRQCRLISHSYSTYLQCVFDVHHSGVKVQTGRANGSKENRCFLLYLLISSFENKNIAMAVIIPRFFILCLRFNNFAEFRVCRLAHVFSFRQVLCEYYQPLYHSYLGKS
jgi:hypothetical protein